jgi:Fe-S cluster biogenesis protein NfuA
MTNSSTPGLDSETWEYKRRLVANNGGFQEQVKRLGELVGQFDQMPDGTQKTAGKELIQLLMDVHAQGLERVMEIIFESGEAGSTLIDQLGKDEVSGGLLLLYSLHPDAVETRVHAALERIRPRLRKLSCAIDLVSIDEGSVRVCLSKSGHSCGSSTKELRGLVENGIYEIAPDVSSLEILGLEEPSSTGFVALESLLANTLVDAASARGGAR